MDRYRTKIRLLPAQTDMPRIYPVRLGEVDAMATGSPTLDIQEGLYDYATMEWGPQPIRLLWLAQHPGLAFGVRADSDIYTVADLKGRKVAAFTSAGQTRINEGFLAFAGLTWDDVERVECINWITATEMVMEGKIDTNYANVSNSLMIDFESRPYGLRLLPTPSDDKEGWARMVEVVPYFVPFELTIGAGVSPENPVEGISYPYPVLVAYDNLAEERAYFITKAIDETYEMFAPKHDALKAYWQIDTCLKLFEGFGVPLHEGSIRYFKEIGRWTDEYEALNKERVERQAELAELWEVVKKEALESGMKLEDSPELWLEKRAAAGF